jgi:hypothetical protein
MHRALLLSLITASTAVIATSTAAQTLTSPLPANCTPTISGFVVSCGGTTPPVCPATPPVCPTQPLPGCAACTPAPPVCAPTPPVCPATVPAGCAPCTPPPEPPAVSCGDLKVIDGGAFSFASQQVWDIRLGRGDKEVYILKTTITAADAGKQSHINIVEHGSAAHYKTVWASKTRCLMDGSSMEGSNSSPSVYVSVNGTAAVNMAVGETWFFMWRNLSSSGKNTCGDDGGCGERISAYQWQNGATVFQRGGPLPRRDQPKKAVKK